jgi:hypothetical protein
LIDRSSNVVASRKSLKSFFERKTAKPNRDLEMNNSLIGDGRSLRKSKKSIYLQQTVSSRLKKDTSQKETLRSSVLQKSISLTKLSKQRQPRPAAKQAYVNEKKPRTTTEAMQTVNRLTRALRIKNDSLTAQKLNKSRDSLIESIRLPQKGERKDSVDRHGEEVAHSYGKYATHAMKR